ncbi:MAG: hypothetical protein KQA36_00685 [Candidatus Aenigmarchaeota archaeon]|nr:hypothetical protein [Candidatus Aenigmarchaeota archaeon]
MPSILEFLFEFLLAFLVFLSETFSFISLWAGRFIYLAFTASKIYEIIIISIIVGIVLYVLLKIGIGTAKTIFIIILILLLLLAIIVII